MARLKRRIDGKLATIVILIVLLLIFIGISMYLYLDRDMEHIRKLTCTKKTLVESEKKAYKSIDIIEYDETGKVLSSKYIFITKYDDEATYKEFKEYLKDKDNYSFSDKKLEIRNDTDVRKYDYSDPSEYMWYVNYQSSKEKDGYICK